MNTPSKRAKRRFRGKLRNAKITDFFTNSEIIALINDMQSEGIKGPYFMYVGRKRFDLVAL